MYPEERVLLSGIQLVIEVAVILVGEFRWLFGPCRLGGVDDFVAVGVDIFAVLPLLLLAADNGHREETAIFLEQKVDACLLEIFLVVIVDPEGNLGAACRFVARLHGVFGRAVACPAHGFGSLLVGERAYLDFARHHEGRVKAEAEVADDGVGVVFVFIYKLFRA